MSVENGIDELVKYKGEAATRKARRSQRLDARDKNKETVSDRAVQDAPTQAQASKGSDSPADPSTELESLIAESGEQIGSFIKQLEDEVDKSKGLALLTAFTVGVIIGQLISRR